MNREILHIAIPSIVTNITVPLLGIVDLAIVGHASSMLSENGSNAIAIGAIAVGTMIFNMVYWLFNFLRIGSSGLTAQAFGSGDINSQRKVLKMALSLAFICGLGILIIQRPIEQIASLLVDANQEVWQMAVAYYRVRIWAAPAVLSLFALNGWFIGMQNSRYPMYIAIGQNIINIAASLLLVYIGGIGIEGVALGTVISQYVGLFSAAIFCLHILRNKTKSCFLPTGGTQEETLKNTPTNSSKYTSDCTTKISLKRFWNVNRDIFFRMICMIAVTTAFTAIGSRQGETLLAVNTLLMQLFTLFSYFSDGFALAGEALVGKYIGARNIAALRQCVLQLLIWGGGVAVIFTIFYLLGINSILQIFTSDTQVLYSAHPYLPWAISIPIVSFAAFAWDGIFIGATATREMLYTLFWSTIVFFGIWALPLPIPSNHKLWAAFITYLATRSLVQTWMAKRVF